MLMHEPRASVVTLYNFIPTKMYIWSTAIGGDNKGQGKPIPSSTQRLESFSDNTLQPYLNVFLDVDSLGSRLSSFQSRATLYARSSHRLQR